MEALRACIAVIAEEFLGFCLVTGKTGIPVPGFSGLCPVRPSTFHGKLAGRDREPSASEFLHGVSLTTVQCTADETDKANCMRLKPLLML